jgi:hypothetical protein
MKQFLAILILLATVQPALPQSFVHRGRGEPPEERPFIDTGPSAFDKSFSDFDDALDNMGSHMKKDYEDAQTAAAKKQELEAQAAQADTENTLNQSFQNSQYQAAASGGLYNNNPGGTGYGGIAVGNFAAPRVQGKYYGAPTSYNVPKASGIYRSSFRKK